MTIGHRPARWWAILAVGLFAASAGADQIQVKPGEGTISAAASSAKPGDVLVLEAGEYKDQVRLPGEVVLRGAGAGSSVVVATGYAAVTTSGPNVVVQGIEFRAGGDKTVRGINSTLPVRVERCRFKELKEAVALMTAPLSDVVRCEFIDCQIGVRAIGGASPTVWGCVFRAGTTGIFEMEGAPYIRNNIFVGQGTGLRLVTGSGAETAIVRNNVFIDCKGPAVTIVAGKGSIFGPSIRNNMVSSCGGVAAGPENLLSGLSHCAVAGVSEPWFRDAGGGELSIDRGKQHVLALDSKVALRDDDTVETGNPDAVAGKGIRLCSEPKGTAGVIGLSEECAQPGVNAPADAAVPAVRFQEDGLVVNCVAEEYQALQAWGLRAGGQGLVTKNGKAYDEQRITRAGKEESLAFEISRFFGEMGLEP